MKQTFLLLFQGKARGQKNNSDFHFFLTLRVIQTEGQDVAAQQGRINVSQELSTGLHMCLGLIAGVCMKKRQKENKSRRAERESQARRRQYDCVNYEERCKENKTKRNTQRPSHSTSEVVCGSGVVT